MILPSATLAQADAPPEALAERSGQTLAKNRPAPAEHARNASGHAWTRTAHDGPRSPQAGALAAGYASPAATGTAHRGPRKTPYTETEGTQTPRTSAGRVQDERKIKPGENLHPKKENAAQSRHGGDTQRGPEDGSQATKRPGRGEPHQGEKKTRRKRCPRRD